MLLKENQIAPVSSRLSQLRAIFLWASYGVFLGVYLALTIKYAVRNPLWMDEVLSVWASRFPTPSQIYQALLHGAQYSPPAYSWMLHYNARIFSDSNLTYRLPSICAAIITGIVSLALLKRYLDTPSSIFASCLILETLSPFGLQARPYTIVTLCFTVALLLWDDLNRGFNMWRVAAIALLLSIAIAFHFYAVLFVPCFGLIELLRTLRTRQIRYAVWVALVLAGGSIFLWLPIMRATSHLAAEDVAASHAFGPDPTIPSLIASYSYLFQGLGNIRFLGGLGMTGLIILCALCLIPLGRLYDSLLNKRPDTDATAPKARNQRNDFWMVVLGSLILPLIVFVFSLVVTKTFNLRYVIAGSIGASAVLAEVLSGFPYFRRVVPAILLVASVLTLKFGVPSMEFFDHNAIYGALPGRDPVVVADGSQFFQLEESAPVVFRSRLIYLTVPPDVAVGDASNLHEIMMWKRIRPDLPVEDARTFLSEHGRFYVLDERTADDTPAVFLLGEGKIDPWEEVSGAMIFRSRPRSSSDAW